MTCDLRTDDAAGAQWCETHACPANLCETVKRCAALESWLRDWLELDLSDSEIPYLIEGVDDPHSTLELLQRRARELLGMPEPEVHPSVYTALEIATEQTWGAGPDGATITVQSIDAAELARILRERGGLVVTEVPATPDAPDALVPVMLRADEARYIAESDKCGQCGHRLALHDLASPRFRCIVYPCQCWRADG